MVVKVKEPLRRRVRPACARARSSSPTCTWRRCPSSPTRCSSGSVTGIAYETITDRHGRLPLLTPMSEVAGRMAVLVGASYLQKPFGGRGTLLAGVPGVPPGDVVIIGGGIVGLNSAKMALGLGARVDGARHQPRPPALPRRHLPRRGRRRWRATTTTCSPRCAAPTSLIGAVLIPGRSAPKLVTREMLRQMKDGRGGRRRRRRPGRLLRDHPPDHPLGPGLRRSTASSTTAWPTCRARCRAPRRSRSTTPRLPYTLALANKGVAAGGARRPRPRSPGSTPTRATSPASRWRSRRGGRTRRSSSCWRRETSGASASETTAVSRRASPSGEPARLQSSRRAPVSVLHSSRRSAGDRRLELSGGRRRMAKASRQAWRAGRGKSRSGGLARPRQALPARLAVDRVADQRVAEALAGGRGSGGCGRCRGRARASEMPAAARRACGSAVRGGPAAGRAPPSPCAASGWRPIGASIVAGGGSGAP